MTQDEIIEMAIQGHASTRDVIRWAMNQEREACANIVEENANKCGVDTVAWMLLASNAEAIRTRGQA